MRYGPDYHNARQMQTALVERIYDGKTPARDAAQLARTWIELEKLKRKIRGIPALASASLKDLADFKLARAKQIEASRPAFTEIDIPSESM